MVKSPLLFAVEAFTCDIYGNLGKKAQKYFVTSARKCSELVIKVAVCNAFVLCAGKQKGTGDLLKRADRDRLG